MKAGTFINKSFLPSAQSTEIFCYLWNFVCKQLEGDTAQGLAVNGNVEEHGGVDHGWTVGEAPGGSVCKALFSFLDPAFSLLLLLLPYPPHSTLYKPVRVVILT